MTPPSPRYEGSRFLVFIGLVNVLGIMGVLWLTRIEPSQGQDPAPVPEQPQLVTTPPVTTQPRVLTFTLTLSEPDDLKVRQGDAVAVGDVLADRTRERVALQSQLEKTQRSLQRIQAQQVLDPPPPLPVPAVAGLPPVYYGTQEAKITAVEDSIDLQKRKIDLLATMPPSDVPPAMREHEERVLEGLYRDLELAKAELKQAQERRAHQEHEYSLAMARRAEEANQQQLMRSQQLQQAEQQRREKAFQEAQLQAQIEAIQAKLSDLSTVRSPYAGTIRRVKWLGQNDNRLTVEITLATGGGASPADAAGIQPLSFPSPGPGD